LRDQPNELISKIKLTPYAREEFEYCKTPTLEPVENARRFFVSNQMSISSAAFEKSTGWRAVSSIEQKGVNTASEFIRKSNSLLKIAERLAGVHIECRDAKYIIKRYDNDTALIYFDPPYVAETRATPKQYILETDNAFHIEAAELLRNAKGYVIVSGYACPLYTELYENHGWERKDKEAQTNSGGKRIESLWLSPRTSEALKGN
jgi:DNA adenine methylase